MNILMEFTGEVVKNIYFKHSDGRKSQFCLYASLFWYNVLKRGMLHQW